MSLMQAAIAANRFGLGAKPNDLKRLASDPRGALRAELGAPWQADHKDAAAAGLLALHLSR